MRTSDRMAEASLMSLLISEATPGCIYVISYVLAAALTGGCCVACCQKMRLHSCCFDACAGWWHSAAARACAA